MRGVEELKAWEFDLEVDGVGLMMGCSVCSYSASRLIGYVSRVADCGLRI